MSASVINPPVKNEDVVPHGKRLYPLATVARMFGVEASPAALYRWVSEGVNGVKLPAKKVGQKLMISTEAFEKFIDAQNQPNEPEASNQPGRTEETARQLEAAGLLK